MCGRFVLAAERDTLAFHLEEAYAIDAFDLSSYSPRYNIAPGQDILAVVGDGEARRAGYLKWGYTPLPHPGKKALSVINARAERVLEKTFFSESVRFRRCVILASGVYEWKKNGTQKTPMHITLEKQTVFPMAGIYVRSSKPDGETIFTCAIMTVGSRGAFARLHHRMPKILTRGEETIWLDPAVTETHCLQTLLESQDLGFAAVPVSDYVNNAAHEGPQCIEPRS